MNCCDTCNNMLNLTIDKDDNSLKYMCKACNTTTDVGKDFNPCVHKSNYGGNEKVFYEMFINEYSFEDPTLPRSKNIPCPNCSKDKTKNEEDVVYVRYNDDDMKYIYLCCGCKKAWINPEYQKYENIEYK